MTGREENGAPQASRVGAPQNRPVALAAGIVCHLSFLAGVGSMVAGIFTGLRFGRGPFTGAAAVAANTLLVLQFPLLHSWLLSRRGARVLDALAPAGLGRTLATTTFATISSLQILAVFAGWSPVGAARWTIPAPFYAASCAAYALSWLFLGKAMLDANIFVQSGALGWLALFRGRAPAYGPMPERGTFRLCRQPIYLAFALALWTAPVWTWDRFALAVAWGAYCVVGPVLKEARFVRYYGEKFREYQRRHRFLLPLGARRPARCSVRTSRSA
jgi:protein-S-isoprenylcysteine O-methyltransferase Ste14